MDKEAVIKVNVFMKYDSSKMTGQQALDTLEEKMNEVEDVSINFHDRYTQDSPDY